MYLSYLSVEEATRFVAVKRHAGKVQVIVVSIESAVNQSFVIVLYITVSKPDIHHHIIHPCCLPWCRDRALSFYHTSLVQRYPPKSNEDSLEDPCFHRPKAHRHRGSTSRSRSSSARPIHTRCSWTRAHRSPRQSHLIFVIRVLS